VEELGMSIKWQGSGVDEVGIVDSTVGECDKSVGDVIIRVDPRYFRPAEVETLLGDASKAKTLLGWTPKISFTELVVEMVENDLKHARKDALLKKNGYDVSIAQE
jgi:GDPmannose 4,6-dehydratase